jgi:hypothetical protein
MWVNLTVLTELVNSRFVHSRFVQVGNPEVIRLLPDSPLFAHNPREAPLRLPVVPTMETAGSAEVSGLFRLLGRPSDHNFG